MEPTQLSFSIGKPAAPKARCLGCRKMGYTTCKCHLVAQNQPLPRPENESIFIPDDKGITTKPKRKYTRKKDKPKDQVDKPKRKYTKKTDKKKTITHDKPKNQIPKKQKNKKRLMTKKLSIQVM